MLIVSQILTALVKSIPLPIDVKIRLLPSQPETISLVSLLAKSGVSALTVHCRTEPMRSSEPALLDRLQEIVTEVQRVNAERKANGEKEVAIIANGDCVTVADKERICAQTGS